MDLVKAIADIQANPKTRTLIGRWSAATKPTA